MCDSSGEQYYEGQDRTGHQERLTCKGTSDQGIACQGAGGVQRVCIDLMTLVNPQPWRIRSQTHAMISTLVIEREQ